MAKTDGVIFKGKRKICIYIFDLYFWIEIALICVDGSVYIVLCIKTDIDLNTH